jgi:ech hydrogenase subunit C
VAAALKAEKKSDMRGIKESPWIIHYDASSCNGCDIETLACLTPLYDVERLGVLNTGNPKHADIFLVTGAVNTQSEAVIRNIYHQLPEPKVVVAVGICACSGGIFRECYNISGGVDSVIPVDVYVPGCAARPEAIIDGVVKALAVLEEKHRDMQRTANSLDQTLYQPADKSDAAEILALQKIAYQSEAELYGDHSLPAMNQTLQELEADFERVPDRVAALADSHPAAANGHGSAAFRLQNDRISGQPSSGSSTASHSGVLQPEGCAPMAARIVFVKAVVNGKIIGSVRGYALGQTAYIRRMIVHPYFRRRGVGRRLLKEIENAFPEVKRFEAKTGHESKRNLFQLSRSGYEVFRTEPFTPQINWIYLQKDRVSAAAAKNSV